MFVGVLTESIVKTCINNEEHRNTKYVVYVLLRKKLFRTLTFDMKLFK